MYPGGQVHAKLPGVFVQVAIGLQPPLFTAHSSISATSLQVRKSTTACTKIRLLLRMFFKVYKNSRVDSVFFVVETHHNNDVCLSPRYNQLLFNRLSAYRNDMCL